jgi:Zn-dependent protease
MFIETLQSDPRFFCAVVFTVVVSICIHELAHGVVAVALGDRTPIETGHMTLNPAVHMGMFSVIVLLISGIAWGSMPVNPGRLRGRHSDAWVALAGPAANVVLAVIALGALGTWWRLHPESYKELSERGVNGQYMLWIFGFVNMHLALFNLIPIAPLDGWRVLSSFSHSYARTMEALSMSGAYIVVFILVFSLAGRLTQPVAANATIEFTKVAAGPSVDIYEAIRALTRSPT